MFHCLPKIKLLSMSLGTEVTYQYLEPRQHPWRKILWITGRNMHVWQIWWLQCCERERHWKRLPGISTYRVEKVAREALDYDQRNKALVDAETEEEGQRLRTKGQL